LTPVVGEPSRYLADGTRSVVSIEREEIEVVFQPIVDLATGAVFATEALTRCQLDEYRNPAKLFEQASAEQACGRLGRMIREVALARISDAPLFVNIHPDELSSRWLVRPDDPICFHDAPVYLEITESATFEHYDLCANVLKEVCSRTGAHLVVDDLGAGYSNLRRMLDLRPDVVKLDLTLAHELDKHPRQRVLVRQLIALCGDLGAQVVVEGVETVDELKAARDAGAQFAQGFVLARPAFPVPEIDWPL
jgi:EAL domain-containing protein (putative c-di-GMP-specific phosphodiesterase class I)